MSEGKYTITFKLGNPNKDGLCKIYIRVRNTSDDFKIPTKVSVNKSQFNGKKVIGRKDKDDLNAIIQKEVVRIQNIITDSYLHDTSLTSDMLLGGKSSPKLLSEGVKKYLSEITNASDKKNKKSVYDKLPDMPMSKMTVEFLKDFEKQLRQPKHGSKVLDQNSVHTQARRVKTLLLWLVKKEYIRDQKVINAINEYVPPKYIQKIPEYLTEDEIKEFHKITSNLGDTAKKRAGYYFLLSCFTGYRLGDLLRFDYDQVFKGGQLIVRAGKNNKIVSIPVYPMLQDVLNFCKDSPLALTEQHFRLFVKSIASDMGIDQRRRNIKIHTGRHSFAMMLIGLGFTIDEVAELIGDDPRSAKIYARITNPHLSKKIMEKLG
ncbi:MAG: tyrosine-type recombinase/integrase [Niabella sp.]|nr:tyrosine-type recombinase/integrase [Niabella sp.]